MFRQILIASALVFLSAESSAQKKVEISYIGYFQDKLESWPKLEFEIRNLTGDTLYLSRENIKFVVTKDSKRVEQEQLKTTSDVSYTPFIRPRFEECPEGRTVRDKLAQDFARKLVLKSKVAQDDQPDAIQNIWIVCIVIYPNETVYTRKSFWHRNFDKTYEVELEPYKDNVFDAFGKVYKSLPK